MVEIAELGVHDQDPKPRAEIAKVHHDDAEENKGTQVVQEEIAESEGEIQKTPEGIYPTSAPISIAKSGLILEIYWIDSDFW